MASTKTTIDCPDRKIWFEAGTAIANGESVHYEFKRSYDDCLFWTGRLLRGEKDIEPKDVKFNDRCKILQRDKRKGDIEIGTMTDDKRKAHEVFFEFSKPHATCPAWIGRYMRQKTAIDPREITLNNNSPLDSVAQRNIMNSDYSNQAASVQAGNKRVQSTMTGQHDYENTGIDPPQTQATATAVRATHNVQQNSMTNHSSAGYSVPSTGMASAHGAPNSVNFNQNRHPAQSDSFAHPSGGAQPPQNPMSYTRGGAQRNGGPQAMPFNQNQAPDHTASAPASGSTSHLRRSPFDPPQSYDRSPTPPSTRPPSKRRRTSPPAPNTSGRALTQRTPQPATSPASEYRFGN